MMRKWWHRWFHREVSRFKICIIPLPGTRIRQVYDKSQRRLMNQQILDDGQGIKYVATPNHPLKADETPAWAITQGNPAALTIAPDPTDPSGLTLIGKIPSPPIDTTGIVVTVSTVRDSDGQTVKEDSQPVDIVPDPNNDVSGFTIQQTAL